MAFSGPTEASIAVLLREIFAECFVAYGYPPVPVLQSYQPTQQGEEVSSALYFHRLPERRVGWPQRKDVFDIAAGDFVHEESTQFEVTYQFNAMTPPIDPAVQPPALTPADILRAGSFALQSDRALKRLHEAGMGVLRVTDLRLVYATDDREQFEPEPSFDAVLTYRNTFTDRVGLVAETELEIFRV